MMMNEQPAKKQKIGNKTEEVFRMVISAPCSFKNMCDILGSVFETLTFTVANSSGSFSGMKVNALDSKQVAFVQLKYACQVTFANDSQEEVKTCVKLKHLIQLLKYVPNISVLHIVQYASDNNLTLETFDERRSKKVFYIKTLQLLEDDDVSMQDMNAGNLIEFDLSELKGFVKHSQESKATEIDFSILANKSEDRNDRLIVTKFFGEAGRCGFHHQPEKDASTTKMLGETHLDMGEWKPFYKGTFDSAMIHSFLKNMDRESKIVVCLSDDVMILDYNLGIESSHIRFYLAVKDVDESEN
jgi:hypothetical protein